MNQYEQFQTELAEITLDKEVENYNEQRAEGILKLIKKTGARRVLDIGCGLGKVTTYLAEKNLDVTGIDISPRLIELARKKSLEKNIPVQFHITELNKFEPEEKFDVVLFAGVLEHIEEDEQMMKDAQHLLKENGHIIITVPAFSSLFNLRDRRIGHLRRYTKKSMKSKLNRTGYRVMYQKYYSFAMIFGALYLKIFKKDEYPFGAVNFFTDKLLNFWYKHLENNFVFPVGEHLYSIGKLRSSK